MHNLSPFQVLAKSVKKLHTHNRLYNIGTSTLVIFGDIIMWCDLTRYNFAKLIFVVKNISSLRIFLILLLSYSLLFWSLTTTTYQSSTTFLICLKSFAKPNYQRSVVILSRKGSPTGPSYAGEFNLTLGKFTN